MTFQKRPLEKAAMKTLWPAEVETLSLHSISAWPAPVDLEAWNRNRVLYGSFMGLLDPHLFSFGNILLMEEILHLGGIKPLVNN